jgi:stress-induced morphogen
MKSKIQQHFKITVKSKGNQSAETIKEILKAKINPSDIQVGINSLKTLTDGRVLITAERKMLKHWRWT